MGLILDIKDVFEKIAKTHTGIGHAPDAVPALLRFYGYDMDESNTGDMDGLSFPRMGLGMKIQSGLTGKYENDMSALKDTCYIEVIMIDQHDEGDFAAQYDCYDRMKKVMDDIVSWIAEAVRNPDLKCKYPVLSYINASMISYSRVHGITGSNACGWKMTIPIISITVLTDANPLNAL